MQYGIMQSYILKIALTLVVCFKENFFSLTSLCLASGHYFSEKGALTVYQLYFNALQSQKLIAFTESDD